MYYFAYASNLSQKQMAERCPGAKPLYTATLPNYKLIFAGWARKWRGGVASIRRCRDEKVLGAVYEISERNLYSLDKYEGYPATCDRLNVLVITRDGEKLGAVTYVKRGPLEETKPSREYLAVIQQGYRDWRIAYDKGV